MHSRFHTTHGGQNFMHAGGISRKSINTHYNTKLKQFLYFNKDLSKTPEEGVCAVLLPEAENVCASQTPTDPPKSSMCLIILNMIILGKIQNTILK